MSRLNIPRISQYDELLPVIVDYTQNQAVTIADWAECARAWWRLGEVESFFMCLNKALQLVNTFEDQCLCADLLEKAGDPNALEFIQKQFPV